MSEILLQVEGLSAGYGADCVIHDIVFSLPSGSILGLLGPNGSGKTTLLRCLAGSRPLLAGRIVFNGVKDKRERQIATVGSETLQARAYTVMQSTLLGRFPWLSWLGNYSDYDRECAKEALTAAGILPLARRKLSTLSGGQQQMAGLSRGFAQIWATPAPLLILDEPAANLDLSHALHIFGLLKELARENWTVIAALHDCNLAALFCTHLLGLRNGSQLFFGSVNEVFTEYNLGRLYGLSLGIFSHPDLGVPQIYARL